MHVHAQTHTRTVYTHTCTHTHTLTRKLWMRGNSGTRWGTVMIQKSKSGNSENALDRKSHDLKQPQPQPSHLRKTKNSTVHAGLHDWHKGFPSKHMWFQIIHCGKLTEHWPHLISFIDAEELDAESVGATKVLWHKALGERRDLKRHGSGGTWRTRLVWQTEHASSIITVAPL